MWVIYLGFLIYEFFVTPSQYELFRFTIISLPIVLILDYLFARLKR